MKITKLEYQKKDPNRVNVYVDDKFAVGLEANDIIKLGIFSGQEISQEELNKIIGESEFGKLLNKAINFLSYRPRSEWEIRQFLKKKDPGAAQDDIIEKLKKLKLVDDETFAKWYVEQRNTFRPKSRRILEMELRRKGVKIKPETDLSETELAKRALGKKKFMVKEKAIRFLASRGFSWETIEDVIK
ncbi:RecX family transcriptional regulator [Candidatus Gottesmanbacteria bacterium]|nr:RecX family transcriptional regulator [Candidatus Gottesmanbacteria bacterium]